MHSQGLIDAVHFAGWLPVFKHEYPVRWLNKFVGYLTILMNMSDRMDAYNFACTLSFNRSADVLNHVKTTTPSKQWNKNPSVVVAMKLPLTTLSKSSDRTRYL